MRIVVLGAGFGGLELCSVLAEEAGDDVEVTLVDRSSAFVFGFSKLDVLFGDVAAEHVLHHYRDLAVPGVRFLETTVRAIDPVNRRVETDAGVLDADVLVVALGAEVVPAATAGLAEHGHEYYSVAGAFATREVLRAFDGGPVVVGAAGAPFKCPPAASETALLVDEWLRRRGLRERSSVTLALPFPRPIPPSAAASAAVVAAFAERDIAWLPQRAVAAVAGSPGEVTLDDGTALPAALFLAIPRHRAPQVVVDAGLTKDGWVVVDPQTLQTAYPDVYALGDVASVGVPKAGAFAEGQGAAVAHAIVAGLRGTPPEPYRASGSCYVEFGRGEVGRVDVVVSDGVTSDGPLAGPSPEVAAEKEAFAADRIRRWFGREWSYR